MSDLVLAALGGAAVGMWLATWAWRVQLRQKCESGIRLECGGSLYHVIPGDWQHKLDSEYEPYIYVRPDALEWDRL